MLVGLIFTKYISEKDVMDSVPRSTFEESLDIIETLLDEFDVKPRG